VLLDNPTEVRVDRVKIATNEVMDHLPTTPMQEVIDPLIRLAEHFEGSFGRRGGIKEIREFNGLEHRRIVAAEVEFAT